MRACVVTFIGDMFSAHDIASMLYTAPKEATVRWIKSQAFGMEVDICLACPLFRDEEHFPQGHQAIAGLFKVQDDGSSIVAVPWPWDDEVVDKNDLRRRRQAILLGDRVLFDYADPE